MNKTLTVNIGGMVFHIEEHAYEKMRRYLDAIKGYFTTSEGRDEIIQDVEARIAEMFAERIKDSKEVIVEEDVEHVISVMGRPEQFAGDEAGESAERTFAANISEKRNYRKLYRDPDDKVIAGVCAGLAHRLGIDPIWLRLIFVLALFIAFGSLFIYIILALVLPYAVTTGQKLEMKGEDVTVSNIRKAVEEPSAKKQSFVSRFFETLGDIIKAVLKGLLYIIGAFFAIIGLFVLFALFIALLAVIGVGGITIPVFISDLFLSPAQQFWSMVAIFLAIGIPVIMLLYWGIRLIFRIKQPNRFFNRVAVTLMVLGWIIGFWMIAVIGREFSTEGRQRSVLPLLSPTTDTLFVDVMDDAKYEDEDGHSFYNGIFTGNDFSIRTGEDISKIAGLVQLDIQKAEGDKFELVKIVRARGTTEKQAYEAASKVNYNFEQKDSLIKLSNYFPVTKNMKYRGQHVKLILKVPVGKSVYLKQGSRNIIYDIKNVTNTYDGDMIGRTWTMTEDGLECKTCNFKEWQHPYEWDGDEEGNIDDAHIHIDKKGVHIKAKGIRDSGDGSEKDVNIRIDENGVVIDSKDK
jgi:phage shock protein PspC (stress-responsive transcriptional regulator)